MPDLEALEMQNAAPPVYNLMTPCLRTVDRRILIGDCAVVACPLSSCCRVLTYSVGYFG